MAYNTPQVLTALNIPYAPSISFLPTANPITTYASGLIQAASGQANTREFLFSVGFDVFTGAGAAGAARDKVAIYGGINQNPGAGDVWALNTVTTMVAASGTANAQGYELDFNNLNAHRGDAAAGAGLAAPIAYGLSVTGAGAFRSTAAMLVSGPGTGIWNRGIVFANTSVVQASIQDFCNATTVIDVYGTHTYGLDFGQSATTTALRMGNSSLLSARNAANNADLSLLQLDGSNLLRLGPSGVNMRAYGDMNPGNDNAYTCGANGLRWAVFWGVNGTIQTSDVTLKTDIAPLGSMREAVMAIPALTYRWIEGGNDITEQMVEQEVPVEAEHVWTEEYVEVTDGVGRMATRERRAFQPVYDDVPMVGSDGLPLMRRVFDKDTGRTSEAPATHAVQRMERRLVPVRVPVSRAGRRTHWGFLARDVKQAFDAMGRDFGGYVRGEDGTEGLRADQLLAVLWKDHQDLVQEVVSLRADLAAMKEKMTA